ncbi:MAG: hypothetical protein ACR2L1_03315 [Pyrinomonadaceae bacterium]
MMPFTDGEFCWGETVMNSLTIAVEELNKNFSDSKELHKYIDTGIDPRGETFQTVKSAYAQ